MDDGFVTRKFEWLDQLFADDRISHAAFRLGYRLATKFWNRRTGDAWPTQETLAAEIGIKSVKGVRYLVDQLVGGEHLEVTVAHGRGYTNRYKPIIKAPITAPKIVRDGDLFGDVSAGTDRQTSRRTGAGGAAEQMAFEEWWPHYPRKVGKEAAKLAYLRILRPGKATVAELLAGVMRYAAERDGENPKYTKHPTTWLNGGCWLDEAAPRAPGDRGSTIDQSGAPVAGPQERPHGLGSWTDIAMDGLPHDE